MIASQLATCEECRDGSCDACKRYKRRKRRKARRGSTFATLPPAPLRYATHTAIGIALAAAGYAATVIASLPSDVYHAACEACEEYEAANVHAREIMIHATALAPAPLQRSPTIDPPASTGPVYLVAPIAEAKRSEPRRGAGMNRDGYTSRRGAPTSLMVRFRGERLWRRVMCWQFSNSGTLFLRVQGVAMIVRETEIPEVPSERAARLTREANDLQRSKSGR